MTFDPEPVCVLVMNAGSLRSGLESELTIDGYEVRCAGSIEEAEELMSSSPADVLIVGTLEDCAAPCALLRGLRDGRLADGKVSPALPAMTIVRDGDLNSVLRPFDCGADDVVAQPVRYAELRVRLAALLRMARRTAGPRVQRIGELTIDAAARTARVGVVPVELTNKEWALLQMLVSQPTRVFTKSELLREVWRTEFRGASRTLDSTASRLRRKLAAAGAEHSVLNVWGVGYRLTDSAALAAAA